MPPASTPISTKDAVLSGSFWPVDSRYLARPRDRAIPRHSTSLQQLLGFALIAIWIQFLVPRTLQDPDIWWHLRNASLQLQRHAFLRQDRFSFTAFRAPWINHEWLAELPYWLGWHLAGSAGVLFVAGSAIEIIFIGVYWLAYRKSNSWPSAMLVTLIASLLATVSFGPRTLLFGWLCLIAELVLFEFVRDQPRLAFLLPPLFLVWINLHGSWLIGIALFAIFLVCGFFEIDRGLICSPHTPKEARQIFCLSFALSLCALFINPYGWHLVAYPFDLAFRQTLNVSHVEEWQSLDFQSSRGVLFLASLAVLFLAPILTTPERRRVWTLSELLFLALGTYSAFRHCRFLFLAAILVMPIVGRHLAALLPDSASHSDLPPRKVPAPRMRVLLNAGLLLSMVLLCQAHIARNALLQSKATTRYPAAALPFFKTFRPQGPLFNECLWGGYMAFNVPGLPDFIDSRFDIFERNGTLRDYLDITGLKNSLALLEKYRIRYVFFERDSPLVYLLQQTHQWQPLYDDGSAILLEHAVSRTGTQTNASAAP